MTHSLASPLLVLLIGLASPPAWSVEEEPRLLVQAYVKSVQCHDIRTRGPRYHVEGNATVRGRDAMTGRTRTLRLDVVMTRLLDETGAPTRWAFLCHQLEDMKRTGQSAELFYRVVRAHRRRPRKALVSLTRISVDTGYFLGYTFD